MTPKEKEALSMAVEAIYFADSADYATYLYRIVRVLGGVIAVELLESDERAAYEKYCSGEPDAEEQGSTV